MKRLRELTALLLMLALPLQCVAVVLAPLHCAPQSQAVAAMPCHDQQNSHGAMADVLDSSDSERGSINHLCCQIFHSGITTPQAQTPSQKITTVQQFVIPLSTLFIPDSPYRPPRA